MADFTARAGLRVNIASANDLGKLDASENNEEVDISDPEKLFVNQFGYEGTIVALNKFGELLQINQALANDGKTKLITAEKRDIVALDEQYPKLWDSEAPRPREDSTGDSETEATAKEKSEDEDKLWIDWRAEKFNELYDKQGSGLGLRLASENGEQLALKKMFFRGNRWPEYHLSYQERKIDVNLQYFIVGNRVIQQYIFNRREPGVEAIEIDMELDLTLAMRHGMFGTLSIKDNTAPDNRHSLRTMNGGKICVLESPSYRLTVSIFKDGELLQTSLHNVSDIALSSMDIYLHSEKVRLDTNASMTITATYEITRRDERAGDGVPPKLNHSKTSKSVSWKNEGISKKTGWFYRRTLEFYLSVAAIPVEDTDIATDNQLYAITDCDIVGRWGIVVADGLEYSGLKFLLKMYCLFAKGCMADPGTSRHYMDRIRAVVKGNLSLLLQLDDEQFTSEPLKIVDQSSTEENKNANNPQNNGREANSVYRALLDSGTNRNFQIASYIDLPIVVAQFYDTFPEEKPEVQVIFDGGLERTWKKVIAWKNNDSGLWPAYSWFYDGYWPSLTHNYELKTQVQIWAAVCALRRIKETSHCFSDEFSLDHPELEERTYKEKVLERFTVPRYRIDPTEGSKKAPQKFNVLALARYMDDDVNDFSTPTWFDARTMLINELTAGFFESGAEAALWHDTLLMQDPVGEESTTDFVDLGSIRMVNLLLSHTSTSASDAEEARGKLELWLCPLGFAPLTTRKHIVREFDWQTSWLLLHLDFPSGSEEPLEKMNRANTPLSAEFQRDHIRPFPDNKGAASKSHEKLAATSSTNMRGNSKQKRLLDVQSGRISDKRLNENPAYGPAWLYADPWFVWDPPLWEISSFSKIQDILLMNARSDRSWLKSLLPFVKEEFFKSLTVNDLNKGSGSEHNYNYIKTDSTEYGHSGPADPRKKTFLDGLIHSTNRTRKTGKKMIFALSDPTKAAVCALLAIQPDSMSFRLANFLRSLMQGEVCKEFDFIPWENLWITSFGFPYLELVTDFKAPASAKSPYFAVRHSQFVGTSTPDNKPSISVIESFIGFYFIGDRHDRFWNCYVFKNQCYSEGYRLPLPTDEYPWGQRKVLERYLIRVSLGVLIDSTHSIAEEISLRMGPQNPETLFSDYGTQGSDAEGVYTSRYKHSILYPWLAELLRNIIAKCQQAEALVRDWQEFERTAELKPRWSMKDETRYGETLDENDREIEKRMRDLKESKESLKRRLENLERLLNWTVTNMSLQDARRSVILSESARIFTVVSAIYLPLGFAASVIQVDGLAWGQPRRDLFIILAIVTPATLVILFNLDLIDRRFWGFLRWTHRFLQRKMKSPKPPPALASSGQPAAQEAAGKPGGGSTDLEKGSTKSNGSTKARPSSFWEKKADSLKQIDNRNEFLNVASLPPDSSNWWYSLFIIVYGLVRFPMAEVAFAVRAVGRPVPRVGPLQKVFRVVWLPVWLAMLALAYMTVLITEAAVATWKLAARGFELLWYGWGETEEKEEVDKDNGEKDAADAGDGGKETLETRWWKRPLEAMNFEQVRVAYHERNIPGKGTKAPTEANNLKVGTQSTGALPLAGS